MKSGIWPLNFGSFFIYGTLILSPSENSACPDDKFHFVLEASRRSNAICLQLFSKDNEATPGESAASSILSRYFSDQRGLLAQPSDTQVCFPLLFLELFKRLHS